MPFYLSDRDVSSDVAGTRSVLIVPCRFCPAASLSVRGKKPYIELFRRLLKTGAFESYVRGVKTDLESRGIRATVFKSRWPHHFVLCMWTAARRRKLARHASGHDALIVLGCDAAVETARGCTESNGCQVVPGMVVEGIMNVVPRLRFPFDIWLDVRSVTRGLASHQGAATAGGAAGTSD